MAAVLAALAGCSVVVRHPDPGPPEHWTPCIENRFFPYLDVAAAVGYTAIEAYGSYRLDQKGGDARWGLLFMVPLMIGTPIGFGASAYRGFKVTGECRARHAEYDKLVGP